ncbi:hypothetical protein V2J09_017468 [Rumex salicifolius]
MREALLVQEFEKLRTAKRKGTEEQGDVGQSGGSAPGTRRTRSQATPDWTAQDLLILVFEISAVEGECANALSTYQKWTMVAQNCAALDVPRTSHQCRSKWESLLTEYKKILDWQKGKKGKSYWSLDSGRRKKAGLPLDFTEDLFKAIDEAVKVQGERSGSDPDTDTETEFDAANSMETGSKKLRRHSTHHKEILEEEEDEEEEDEEDEDESTEMEIPRRSAPRKGITKKREHQSVENESQHLSARCKAMNKGKGRVSTENQLQFRPISYEECSEEMEHFSPGNESQHQTVTHRATTEETDHIVLENESPCQSTSCEESAEKEHALKENNSQFPFTPCKANIEPNEHVSVEYKSPKAANPPNGNSEETEHTPVGNKSCYQLSPGKVIMEGDEPDLLRNVPWCQSNANKQTTEKKKPVSKKNGSEEKKQLLAAKLQENTQLIHAIIAGNSNQNAENMPADMKYEEIKRARENADKLIACIAEMAKDLDLLNHAVK